MSDESRPARYSSGVAKSLIQARAEGRSWIEICAKEGMPTWDRVQSWLKRYPAFLEQALAAETMAADARAASVWRAAAEDTGETATQAKARLDALKVTGVRSDVIAGLSCADGALARGGLAIRIREFVPHIRADGRAVTREIFPDGTHFDHER